jgi:hypothetical protein
MTGTYTCHPGRMGFRSPLSELPIAGPYAAASALRASIGGSLEVAALTPSPGGT